MGVLATIVELGSDDTVYGIVLLLHILSAIVGFGGVQLNGLYAPAGPAAAGPGGVAINQAVYAVSKVAEIFIYLIFVFGVLLVLLSENDLIGFGDTWVWLSILLYLIGIGLSHAILFPSVRKANALAEELATGPRARRPGAQGPPPQVVAARGAGQEDRDDRHGPQAPAGGHPLPDDLQARLPRSTLTGFAASQVGVPVNDSTRSRRAMGRWRDGYRRRIELVTVSPEVVRGSWRTTSTTSR